jgi:hypothetical protein
VQQQRRHQRRDRTEASSRRRHRSIHLQRWHLDRRRRRMVVPKRRGRFTGVTMKRRRKRLPCVPMFFQAMTFLSVSTLLARPLSFPTDGPFVTLSPPPLRGKPASCTVANGSAPLIPCVHATSSRLHLFPLPLPPHPPPPLPPQPPPATATPLSPLSPATITVLLFATIGSPLSKSSSTTPLSTVSPTSIDPMAPS